MKDFVLNEENHLNGTFRVRLYRLNSHVTDDLLTARTCIGLVITVNAAG